MHLLPVHQEAVRTFAFRAGDLIYDTSSEGTWGEVLKKIGHAYQVTHATPGKLGTIKYDIFQPNESRSALVKVGEQETTQEKFAELVLGD